MQLKTKRMDDSLIRKAMETPSTYIVTRSNRPVDESTLALAISFAKGHVTLKQAHTALGRIGNPSNTCTYLNGVIFSAIRQGLIEIKYEPASFEGASAPQEQETQP
jgi:hypothetical protein